MTLFHCFTIFVHVFVSCATASPVAQMHLNKTSAGQTSCCTAAHFKRLTTGCCSHSQPFCHFLCFCVKKSALKCFYFIIVWEYLWFHAADSLFMEPKTDGGSESLTSEKLASIEDEEVLNKMVSWPNQSEWRNVVFTAVIGSVFFLVGQFSWFWREAADSCSVEGTAEEKEG